MYISDVSNSPNFKEIRLSKREFNLSENILNRIVNEKDLNTLKTLKLQLFDVFESYLEKESKIKSKLSYVPIEVLSELKIKFFEIINNPNINLKLENIIEQLNKFKPSQYALDLKYTHISLNEVSSGNIKEDLVTEDDIPVADSEILKERFSAEIERVINSNNLSELQQKRLR